MSLNLSKAKHFLAQNAEAIGFAPINENDSDSGMFVLCIYSDGPGRVPGMHIGVLKYQNAGAKMTTFYSYPSFVSNFDVNESKYEFEFYRKETFFLALDAASNTDFNNRFFENPFLRNTEGEFPIAEKEAKPFYDRYIELYMKYLAENNIPLGK